MGSKKYLKKIILEIKNFKNSLLSEIPIDKVVLFGSYARGDFGKYSDVDLIIVSKAFEKKRIVERAVGLHRHWSLNLPVDIICLTPKEYEGLKRRITVVREAVKEGIEI